MTTDTQKNNIAFLNLSVFSDHYPMDKHVLQYPNPVKDYLKISASVRSNIQILNNSDKVMYNIGNISSDGIDMSYLLPGVYLVKIADQNGSIIVKKVAKQ